MSKDDDLREMLDQAAQDISEAQSNPRTWLSWLVYLLGQLEEQSTVSSTANRESFMEMLAALQDAIRNRERTGGWN
jgi:hypothetical protein